MRPHAPFNVSGWKFLTPRLKNDHFRHARYAWHWMGHGGSSLKKSLTVPIRGGLRWIFRDWSFHLISKRNRKKFKNFKKKLNFFFSKNFWKFFKNLFFQFFVIFAKKSKSFTYSWLFASFWSKRTKILYLNRHNGTACTLNLHFGLENHGFWHGF